MILCEKTIEVLNSFAGINPAMVLDWDGSIGVIAPQGNVLAIAKVPEKYPFKWSIYDVPQLLGILKVMDQSAVAECYSDHVILKQQKSSVKYRFAETALIKTVANKQGNVTNVGAFAKIQWSELQQLVKASMLLRNTHVRIDVVDKELLLTSFNLNNPAVSNYNLSIPLMGIENEEIASESSVIKLEFFNILKGDYNFKVAKKCLYLETEDGTIKYWIGKEKE